MPLATIFLVRKLEKQQILVRAFILDVRILINEFLVSLIWLFQDNEFERFAPSKRSSLCGRIISVPVSR